METLSFIKFRIKKGDRTFRIMLIPLLIIYTDYLLELFYQRTLYNPFFGCFTIGCNNLVFETLEKSPHLPKAGAPSSG